MGLMSMTGFGSAVVEADEVVVTVEIRTVNHRFLDIRVHLSPDLPRDWEQLVRREVGDRIQRGRVDVYLDCESERESQNELVIDWLLVQRYHDALKELSDRYDLETCRTAFELINLPGVVELEEVGLSLEGIETALCDGVQTALTDVLKMRQSEGEALTKRLGAQLEAFEQCLETLAESAPSADQRRQETVRERVRELISGHAVAEGINLAAEVALMVQRGSVVEEVDRLQSHADQARMILAQSSPVGRKLEFLIQEMAREANTIASKVADAKLNEIALEMKGRLEDMREQTRNVE